MVQIFQDDTAGRQLFPSVKPTSVVAWTLAGVLCSPSRDLQTPGNSLPSVPHPCEGAPCVEEELEGAHGWDEWNSTIKSQGDMKKLPLKT